MLLGNHLAFRKNVGIESKVFALAIQFLDIDPEDLN